MLDVPRPSLHLSVSLGTSKGSSAPFSLNPPCLRTMHPTFPASNTSLAARAARSTLATSPDIYWVHRRIARGCMAVELSMLWSVVCIPPREKACGLWGAEMGRRHLDALVPQWSMLPLWPSFALQPPILPTDQLSGSLEPGAVRAGVLVSDPQIIPCIRS